MKIKVDGIWKDPENILIKTDEEWKKGTSAWVKVEGVWRRYWEAIKRQDIQEPFNLGTGYLISSTYEGPRAMFSENGQYAVLLYSKRVVHIDLTSKTPVITECRRISAHFPENWNNNQNIKSVSNCGRYFTSRTQNAWSWDGNQPRDPNLVPCLWTIDTTAKTATTNLHRDFIAGDFGNMGQSFGVNWDCTKALVMYHDRAGLVWRLYDISKGQWTRIKEMRHNTDGGVYSSGMSNAMNFASPDGRFGMLLGDTEPSTKRGVAIMVNPDNTHTSVFAPKRETSWLWQTSPTKQYYMPAGKSYVVHSPHYRNVSHQLIAMQWNNINSYRVMWDDIGQISELMNTRPWVSHDGTQFCVIQHDKNAPYTPYFYQFHLETPESDDIAYMKKIQINGVSHGNKLGYHNAAVSSEGAVVISRQGGPGEMLVELHLRA